MFNLELRQAFSEGQKTIDLISSVQTTENVVIDKSFIVSLDIQQDTRENVFIESDKI